MSKKKNQYLIPEEKRIAAISDWIYRKDQEVYDKYTDRAAKWESAKYDSVQHVFSSRFIDDHYGTEVACLARAFWKNAKGEAAVYLKIRWRF